MFKILITGSRDWDDKEAIEKRITIHTKHMNPHDVLIIHGAARGADSLSGEVAKDYGYKLSVHPAEWEKYGKHEAGGLRNQKMVNLKPDICLAFPLKDSIGTYDCIRRARKAGIITEVYRK